MNKYTTLIKVMEFANEGLDTSKEGLETYADDCTADHGDGQQVGREIAYEKVILHCAKLILEEG